MADKNIVYKISVDSDSGTATLRNLKGQIVATQIPVKELRKEFGNFATEVSKVRFNKFNKGLNTVSKQTQNFANSSGAASSAAMELGRVISDAPYGIRGMANNITQLVSQLGFATVSAGSFTLAMRQMWSALMGPLGIVLAITTVVSALDFFFGAQKSAKESSEETTSELQRQREELEKLTENYEGYLKLKEKVIQSTSKDTELLKALVKETLDLTNSDERREVALSKLIKLYPKYFDGKNIDNIKGLRDAEDSVVRILQNKLKLKNALERAEKIANEIQLERIKNQQLEDEGKKPSLERFDALKLEQKEVRELIGVYAALDLEFKKVKQEDRAEASALGLSIIDEINLVLEDNPLEIPIPEELSQETKDKLREYRKKLYADLALTSDLEDFQDFADKFQKGLTAISDFAQAQFERDLVIEQNKTTALNEELNNRLLNENLSAEERKKIQNEIAKNDEALRLKQNEINKKKFNAQKAYNISMAVIDTAKAAAGVMAEAKGGFFARLAQAIPTIAFGLAQVATIASQKFQPQSATTPIRTSTAGGGTGGGDGVGDRSFNFNLVGNTLGNQITDAIQGQFDQPLKAYVVSRDITSQQALDANIKGTASF